MTARRHVLLAAAVLLLSGLGVVARESDPGAAPAGMFDPQRFLPPPPLDNSPRALTELAEVKHYQATATPDQRAAARFDSENESGIIFAGVIGPAWDLAKLPVTAKLIQDIVTKEDDFSDIAKKEFHRNRPWVVDSSIQTCAPHKPSQDTASYPSGHATLGYAMGIVLAQLMPDHAQAILGRSARFAENRLVCGFHFRSDIVAGQQFGTIMALRLLQDPQFQTQMAAAKTELRLNGLVP